MHFLSRLTSTLSWVDLTIIAELNCTKNSPHLLTSSRLNKLGSHVKYKNLFTLKNWEYPEMYANCISDYF